jgi:PTS system mannose-specific IIA component
MTGVVVVTHGRVAMELVHAAQTIVGEFPGIEAVSIDWNDDVNEARERIGSAIRKVDAGDGVLVLTDMFGGTPTNLALTFLEKERVEVLTGVNLPMLVKVSGLRTGEGLLAVANKVRIQGQKSIYVASEILAQMEG